MAVKFALTRILPSLLLFIGLLGSAVLIDYLFHVMKWAWVGRYCGFLGTLLILVSFLYSFRKRNLMQVGSPKALLKGHEVLGWMGALLVLVHGGIHFYALIPWLALLAMLFVVASGLTGRFLLASARTRLTTQETVLRQRGLSETEIDKELLGSSLLVETMKHWRRIHMPLTMVFAGLSLIHIGATLLFWRWR